MTWNEYQTAALRTATEKNDIVNCALGLAGESGEVCDLVKKWQAQGHDLDLDSIAEEIGDLLWYVALAADRAGMALEDVAGRNMVKLSERYPNGFDPKRSVER